MAQTSIPASIAAQATLLGLALLVILIRAYIRLHIQKQRPTVSDYFAIGGWLLTLGWVACSSRGLHIDGGLGGPPSSEEMKLQFISAYFFDIGLFFPKASVVAFYWQLVPPSFKPLRIALYISTAYLAAAFLCSVLLDTLWCLPVSDNWSLEHADKSIWNSYIVFGTDYALNLSTDLLIFVFPFFMLRHIQLRHRQKVSLVGVFSLGLITIVISVTRFAVFASTKYNLGPASGDIWCTAEMCTALIVVSLPGLKLLLGKKGNKTPSTGTTQQDKPRKSMRKTDTSMDVSEDEFVSADHGSEQV